MVVAWVIVNFKAPVVTMVANGNAGRRSISSALAEIIILRPCPFQVRCWGYGARDRRVFAVAFVLRTARFALRARVVFAFGAMSGLAIFV